MRICSPQLGLAPNSILGGEVFDREILKGLAQRGVKLEIILPKGKPHDKGIRNWHITYVPFTHFPAIFGNLIFAPFLFKVHAKRPYRVIRLHSPRYLGLAALVFKFFNPKVKIVATYHQFRESNFGPFSKVFNNLWDHTVCDSQNVKKKLVEIYKIPQKKITVVHNGVPNYLKPTSKDKKLVQKLELEGKIVLLFMGLFIKRKNPLFLLDILAKLSKARSDIVLIFLGSGPLRSKIVKKSKEVNVYDKIRILDPIFGPEKNKIHNICDIFVHPALDEGFALAPLEAMACAKPIVITQGFSASEAVNDGTNGYLCYYNDTNYWVQKLNNLIKNSALRKRMGAASFKKVKSEFKWDKAIAKHLDLLK